MVKKALLAVVLGGVAVLMAGRPWAGRTRYEVVHGWPQVPAGFSFGHVPGVAVDSHDHVWVFHRGIHPIVQFEGKTGRFVRWFGDGTFLRPHGLRVDAQDNVWVTDKDQNLIYKFDHDGKLLMTVGTKGVKGADATHFDGVADLAFAPNGDFYVADGYYNNRIAKFSKDGKFLMQWGSKGTAPGQFDVPHGIAIDRQQRLYVADRSNARVQVFDAGGKFLREWKSAELGRPWGVTVTRDGFLYLVDGGDAFLTQNKTDPNPTSTDRARVLKMDLDGHVLATIGSYGRYDGQFIWAHSVAVGGDGALYVADVHTGMRVQKFVSR
jgi:peptidylamidoglycolate lyase